MSVNLAVFAAVLHGIAYIIYLSQIHSGGSVPNPASWSVWAFSSTLNAFAYASARKDWTKSLQFFTGAVMCLVVFGYSLGAGRFSPLDPLGYWIAGLCIVACVVWKLTRASYASVMMGGILLISGYPTVLGVWRNPAMERPLPWLLWTVAFACTLATVQIDREKIRLTEPRVWMVAVVPIGGILLHGVVAFLAR